MRIRRPYAIALAVLAAAAVIGTGFALAATSSHFTFKATPKKVPKKKYKAGALKTDLITDYDPVPSASNAVDRTRLYLDKNWRVNPKAAKKCDGTQLKGLTMAGAMQACGKALVGKGIATAWTGHLDHGCVLLFNGKPQHKKPTLQVFTRTDLTGATPDCSDPKHNNFNGVTTVLNGVYKKAHAKKYGKVLDVNHITQATGGVPLVEYKTKVKHKDYSSARCKAKNQKWHMQIKWTYKDGTKTTVHKTQKCKVKH